MAKRRGAGADGAHNLHEGLTDNACAGDSGREDKSLTPGMFVFAKAGNVNENDRGSMMGNQTPIKAGLANAGTPKSIGDRTA